MAQTQRRFFNRTISEILRHGGGLFVLLVPLAFAQHSISVWGWASLSPLQANLFDFLSVVFIGGFSAWLVHLRMLGVEARMTGSVVRGLLIFLVMVAILWSVNLIFFIVVSEIWNFNMEITGILIILLIVLLCVGLSIVTIPVFPAIVSATRVEFTKALSAGLTLFWPCFLGSIRLIIYLAVLPSVIGATIFIGGFGQETIWNFEEYWPRLVSGDLFVWFEILFLALIQALNTLGAATFACQVYKAALVEGLLD